MLTLGASFVAALKTTDPQWTVLGGGSMSKVLWGGTRPYFQTYHSRFHYPGFVPPISFDDETFLCINKSELISHAPDFQHLP